MQKYALVYDTESNGFYNECSILWTFCAKDLRTGQRWSFGGPEGCYKDREKIQELLLKSDRIICHNQIKHDLPVLAKLGIADERHWGHARIIDTFVLSSLLNPDRPIPPGCRGAHSLEAYGVLAGGIVDAKVQQEQWSVWEDNMLTRCNGDVDLTEYTYKYLSAESAEDNWDWKRSFEIETQVAFIIAQQERNGWQFDMEAAKRLIDDIDKQIKDIDDILIPLLPPVVIPDLKCPKVPQIKFTTRGEPGDRAVKYWKEEIEAYQKENNLETFDEAARIWLRTDLPQKKVFTKPRNPASQDQMKEYLLTIGWEPTQFTPTGKPKLTEDSLESVQGEVGQLVAKRFILSSRRALVCNANNEEKGLMNLVRPDGRIEALCNTCATPTGRMRHKNVVNIPAARSLLGKEIRSLFTTRVVNGVKYKQVGCDAAGLELRNLASRMGDDRFINMIVRGKKEEGTDVHTYFLHILNEFLNTRDEAKTIEYALIYGAGDPKLGKSAPKGVANYEKRGKMIRSKIMQELPALDRLIGAVQKASRRGYLRGIDGRKIWVRSEHAALNSLLQCDGAIVMKVALIELNKNATLEGLDFAFVGNIHDEIQAEVHPDHADRFAELARNAIRDAGTILGMKCPLEGESATGHNWYETH